MHGKCVLSEDPRTYFSAVLQASLAGSSVRVTDVDWTQLSGEPMQRPVTCGEGDEGGRGS